MFSQTARLVAWCLILLFAAAACRPGGSGVQPGEPKQSADNPAAQTPGPPEPGGAIEWEGPLPTSLTPFPAITGQQLDEIKKTIEKMVAQKQPFTKHYPKLREIAKRLPITANTALAEVDSGTGLLAMALLEIGKPFAAFYALESNQVSLDLQKHLFQQAKPEHGDRVKPVKTTPIQCELAADSVDLVVIVEKPFFGAVETQQGEVQISEAVVKNFKCLHQALKDGGRFDVFDSQELIGEKEKHVQMLSAAFLKAGFKPAGDEVVAVAGSDLFYLRFTK